MDDFIRAAELEEARRKKRAAQEQRERKRPDRARWCLETASAILETDVAWRGVFAFDAHARQATLMEPVPGSRTPAARFNPRAVSDADVSHVLRWFNRAGFPDATRSATADAVDMACRAAEFDPLRDFLATLAWDRKPRIDTWLSVYCGAGDVPLTRVFGRKWLIAGAARGLQPGCKADCALVLEGRQGGGKSSLLRVLGGEWFTDALRDMHTKDSGLALRGMWVVELPELSAMRRTDVEGVKSYLARNVERYRPPYGRHEVVEPRRVVFAGTTNRSDYLLDETGNRRFWPVPVGRIDLAALERDRRQLWAEAVAAYRAGERWWLEASDEAAAAIATAARAADEPWTADVLTAVVNLGEVSTRDVFQRLDVPLDRRNKPDAMRIAGILTRAGWRREGKFSGGPNRDLARYVAP